MWGWGCSHENYGMLGNTTIVSNRNSKFLNGFYKMVEYFNEGLDLMAQKHFCEAAKWAGRTNLPAWAGCSFIAPQITQLICIGTHISSDKRLLVMGSFQDWIHLSYVAAAVDILIYVYVTIHLLYDTKPEVVSLHTPSSFFKRSGTLRVRLLLSIFCLRPNPAVELLLTWAVLRRITYIILVHISLFVIMVWSRCIKHTAECVWIIWIIILICIEIELLKWISQFFPFNPPLDLSHRAQHMFLLSDENKLENQLCNYIWCGPYDSGCSVNDTRL